MRKIIISALTLSFVLMLSGCVTTTNPKDDPNYQRNVAKSPIGLYVQKIKKYGGMTYCDITVKNNSGKFIRSLYVEVIVYDGDKRVGMTNHIFGSVNDGEVMVTQNPINTSGRPWSTFKYTYQITP